MEFFKERNHDLPVMRYRKHAAIFSALLTVVIIASFLINGLHLGLDFTGGSVFEVAYQEDADLDRVRGSLTEGGFGDGVAQHFGSAREVLVRLPPKEGIPQAELTRQVLLALGKAQEGGAELRRVEFVGPQVGKELTESGGLAILYSTIGILIYVAIRFEWRLALGAVLAMLHDVVFTVGMFSLFQIEFDLTVLAAVLAVMGYSLNDTVVVFDRIRENFRKMRKGTTEEIVNNAITQTLSRTIMTSLTTQITVIALLLLGGKVIFGFALALTFGIVFGTYSSVYIASALALYLGLSKANLIPPPKEEQAEARP